jgi:hypothetical protein
MAADQNQMVVIGSQPLCFGLAKGSAAGGEVNRVRPAAIPVADMLPALIERSACITAPRPRHRGNRHLLLLVEGIIPDL